MKNLKIAICLCASAVSAAFADVEIVGSRELTNELTPMAEPWIFTAAPGGETAIVNISGRIQQGKNITVNANVEVSASTGVNKPHQSGNMITDPNSSLVIAAGSKFETGFDAGRFSGSSLYASGGARFSEGAGSLVGGRLYINGYRWNPANDEWHLDNYALFLRGGTYIFTQGAQFRQRGFSGFAIDAPRPLARIENTVLDVRSAEGSVRFDEAAVFSGSKLKLASKNAIVSGAAFGASSQADSIFEIRSSGGAATLSIDAKADNEIGTIRYADGSSLYIDVSQLDGKTPGKAALSIASLQPVSSGAKISVYINFGSKSRRNLAIGNIKKLSADGLAKIYFKNAKGYENGAFGVNAKAEAGGFISWLNSADAQPDKSSRTAEIETVFTDGSKTRQTVNLEVSPDDPSAWRYRVPKENLPAGGNISRINVHFDTSKAVKGEAGYFILGDSRIGSFKLETGALVDVERTVMPVFGFKTPRETWVAIVKGLRLDYDIKVEVASGVYQIYPSFKIAAIHSANLGKTCAYEDLIVDFYPLPDSAEYCDMGRVYRNYQLTHGGLKPLRERVKTNPKLKYTAESVFFRMKMGWKDNYLEIEDQIRGVNEPPLYVQFTFDQTRATLQKLYDLGVRDVEACWVGWGAGAFEGDYPDLHPVPEKLGGEESLKAAIAFAKTLGYQTSCHIDQTDFYTIADRFDRTDITQNTAGEYVKGAMYWNGRAWKPCFKRVFEKYFPADCEYMQSLGIDGMMHIDVTSCIRPYDCFHPDHPCSRQDTADYMNKIGEMCHQYFGGFTSEGPCDHVAKTLDYALYTFAWPSYVGKEEAIIDRIVPFWQSVYHGIILSNPFYSTIDYSYERKMDSSTYHAFENKKVRRLKFFEFGGRPTFYFAITPSVNLEPVAEAYREYQPVKYLQYEYIESHREVAPGVFSTGYSDGSEIVVNYNDAPVAYGGKTIAALDFALFNPRDVSIAGSGKIQAGKPFTLEAECSAVGAAFQWFRDGEAIEGATARTLSVADGTSSAVFRVEITTKNGRKYSSEDFAVEAAPARVYVAANAPAGGDGYSWASALPDLKSALAKADLMNCAAEIWVARGSYAFAETLNVNSSVKIIGGFAGGETSLSERRAGGGRTVFSGGGARALFKASEKCALLLFDGIAFENCASASDGGAVATAARRSVFENCEFANNSSSATGGAVAVLGGAKSARFANCYFSQNSASSGGAASCSGADIVFENATFHSNTASADGGAVALSGCAAAARHSTFFGNAASASGGAVAASGGSIAVESSILWSNSSASESAIAARESAASVRDSVVEGGFAGGENIAEGDPKLAPPAYFEFAFVRALAPDISGSAAGLAPSGELAPARDVWGVARSFPCFAGAAEARGIGATSAAADSGKVFRVFVAGFSDATYKWFKDGEILEGETSSSISAVQQSGGALYECQVGLRGETLNFALAVKTKAPSALYVSPSGSDANSGLSWASAKATLAGALAAAPADSDDAITIKMASGRYDVSSKTTVRRGNIRIVGGFSELSESRTPTAEMSVIDAGGECSILGFAQGVGAGVSFENISFENARSSAVSISSNVSARFKKCRFKNNYTTGNGGAVIIIGAGAPEFDSCVFEGNTADYAGGAVYMRESGAVAFRNCLFLQNKAAIASAVVCNSTNAVLQNCTFAQNGHRLENSSTHCIEVSTSAAPVFDGCTIVGGGTSRETCAIAVYSGAAPAVENCILWGWKATCAQAIRLSSTTASVKNCVIDTGFAGGANVYKSDPELGQLRDVGGVWAFPIGYDGSAAWAGGAGEYSLPRDAAGNPRDKASPCIGALELARDVCFVLQPKNTEAFAGSKTGFFAEVDFGGGVCDWIRWEKSTDNGATWSTVEGAETLEYAIVSARAEDAGLYRCSVSVDGSVAHSLAAKLSVGQAISISQNPSAQSVSEGGSATFSVSASGSNLSYQWQRADAGGAWADIEGATSASYTAQPADASLNKSFFRCKISSGGVSAYSAAAVLSVSANPEISGSMSASETPLQGYITLLDGARFFVDVDTNALSVRAVKNASAQIYIVEGSKLEVANASKYIFGSTLASQNKGAVKISGGGSLLLSGGEYISNIDVDFGVPVLAPFNGITISNADIAISADWSGARFVGGANSTFTIRNGVFFNDSSTYMNFYQTTSAFNLGEPSDEPLGGDARARLQIGSEAGEMNASLYLAGRSYINGYVSVLGGMKTGSQCCSVFLASCEIDSSAEIVQNISDANVPAIFGSQNFVSDGTSGVVSRAGEGSLKFKSRVYLTSGSRLELASSNAFCVGMLEGVYNPQGKSVFTVSEFNQAAAVSGEYTQAMGAASAKLELNAPNDIGGFEFFPGSELEITLNGNPLNIGKFALVPEAESGAFSVRIKDYAPNLIRISAMTEAQIRALNLSDAQGRPIDFKLIPAREGAIDDFYLDGALSIVKSPSGALLREGEWAEFGVAAASGSGEVRYQWQRSGDGGATWVDIDGANASRYGFAVSAADCGALFRCAVSAGGSSATSAEAALGVFGGAVVFVSPDGDNSDGSSWAKAYRTIAKAVASAPQNAQLWIKSGEYTVSSCAINAKNIELIGGFAGNEDSAGARSGGETVFAPSGRAGIFRITNGAQTSFNGVKFANSAVSAAIITNRAVVYLRKCRFVNCEASSNGGAILAENASRVDAVECEFENCSTNWAGGAIFLRDSSGSVKKSYFGGCSSVMGGMFYITGSRLELENTTSYHSFSKSRNDGSPVNGCIGYVINNSSVKANFCTFAQRDDLVSGLFYMSSASSAEVSNSIVWGSENANLAEGAIIDFSRSVANCKYASGNCISGEDPQLGEPEYVGSAFARVLRPAENGSADGAGAAGNCSVDALGKVRAMPNCTAGAFELSGGAIVLADGEYARFGENASASCVRLLDGANADIFIGGGAGLSLSGGAGYLIKSANTAARGTVKISGGGVLQINSADKIDAVNAEIDADVLAPVNDIQVSNCELSIGGSWVGARFSNGNNASVKIKNGAMFRSTSTYMNFYHSTSEFGVGEPSESVLAGDARARLYLGTSESSSASLYSVGRAYINGYVEVNGTMATALGKPSAQFCTVRIAAAEFDKSAQMLQRCASGKVPAVFGGGELEGAGVVSRAGAGALQFSSRVFFADGAKLEMLSQNAFNIGRTDGAFNAQEASTFTICDFDATKVSTSHDISGALGASQTRLILGAPNDVGSFEFYGGSTLEITLGGNALTVGKFELMPEAAGGSFTVKINDFGNGALRISNMTEPQIRALNMVGAGGEKLEYSLTRADSTKCGDFWLTAGGGVSILRQPRGAAAKAGEAAELSIEASGADSYQWQKLSGGVWTDIAGANAKNLSLEGSLASAGKYRCVVSGGGAQTVSAPALVEMFAQAAVYVSPDGADTDGSSWANAYRTIEKAVASAPANSRIFVRAGRCALSQRLSISKNIAICGGFESGKNSATSMTVFDCSGPGCFASVSGASVMFERVEVSGASSDSAISANNAGIILDMCRFSGCAIAKTTNGGAIYAENGSHLCASNCEFENCSTNWAGGAIFLRNSSGNIDAAYIGGCSAKYGGAVYLSGSSLSMSNATLFENYSTDSVSVINIVSSTAELANCTLVQRADLNSSALLADANSSVAISNSVVWGNSAAAAFSAPALSARNCIVDTGCAGENISTANANLASPAYSGNSFARTMAVGAGSPAVGFGEISFAMADACGRPRAVPACTAGAFEYMPAYTQWAYDSGIAEKDMGYRAVPHSDGISNIEKYAFNLDASRASAYADNPKFSLSAGAGGATLRFEARAVLPEGVSVRAQVSNDLINWSDAEIVVERSAGEFNECRVSAPPDASGRVFIRLKVDTP